MKIGGEVGSNADINDEWANGDQQSWYRKDVIQNATTDAELDAIVWEAQA